MASYPWAKASVVFYGVRKVACVKKSLTKLVGSMKMAVKSGLEREV